MTTQNKKAAKANGERGISRPMPPLGMGEYHGNGKWNAVYVPAPEVTEWAKSHILAENAPLGNEDHKHLRDASVQFLWAGELNTKQMRRILGQTEEVVFRAGRWQKGRQEQQMREWFGTMPDYLITLDAAYCMECSDAEFCALVEHELYHIAHELDEFGAPKFNKYGQPKLCLRGHDVEEFVGIVRRYGAGRPDGALAKLINAAKSPAEVARLDIARACGTCMLRAA